MESNSGSAKLDFAALQGRLRVEVVRRINNGEFTERGFARILGISQPQVHNVLKGARKLSPEIADTMLAKLDLSVLDLMTASELEEYTSRNLPSFEIPRKPVRSSMIWKQSATGTMDS